MKNGSTAVGMSLDLARGRPANPARIPTAEIMEESLFQAVGITDAKTDPSLRVAQTLTGPPPAVFGAAITKGSGRPNPAGFIAFLSSAPIRMILNNNGLEHVG